MAVMGLQRLLLFVAFFASPWISLAGVVGEDDNASVLSTEIARQNNHSLLWGPYRPNLYFGVRPRIPKSLMTALMWGNVDVYNEIHNTLRYTCEQHAGMHGYGWDEFDTRRGGIQTIHDAENKIDLTISFVKIPGGAHGGSWAARVKGTLRDDAPKDLKTTVILYVAQEGWGSTLDVATTDGEEAGFSGDFALNGNSETLGDYKLVVTEGTGKHPTSDHEISRVRDLSQTSVQSLVIPEEYLWQGKMIVFRQLKAGIDWLLEKYDQEHLPPPAQAYLLQNSPGQGNAHTVQKTFEGPFEFDIYFSSASAGKEITAADVTREIKETSEAFGERFSSVFELKAPYTAEKYKKFARSMFSNLIGGIGYFYGESLADRSYAPEYDEENEGFWEETAEARSRKAQELEGPFELFSSIPSRPFFPRGFLWDEGFHLLPISDWDMGLTLDIVKSWFNLMDDDGWIAREQILGTEARSKVPEEFQTQYPHYANPPTLYMIVDVIIDKLEQANGTKAAGKERLSQGTLISDAYIDNPELGLEYLRQLYPLLRRQYNWFKKTQFGDIKSYDRQAFSTREAYRWRGRTAQHCLPSGLDDYPRPQPPHPGELHVDLISWMGLLTKSLIRVADVVGMAEEARELRTNLNALERNLVDLHWSEAESCFCDATIDEYEEHVLVCHKGYISIFPFLTGLMAPDDPRLGKILALLGDEEQLFSPHGLRSLSKKDPLYGQDENYWRSPVWVNINYMAIVQLRNIATQDGPHQKTARSLYNRLRRNVVDTVYQSWRETGFAWEQYNPETGAGQRTQHFTGWTSLVVKIMAMEELADGKGRGKDEL